MFDFFGLYRELRDQIYESLLDKQLTLVSKTPVHIRVKNGPHRQHMLVSRQFSAEHLEAVRRRSSIVGVDDGNVITEPTINFPTPTLPRVLRSVRRVEFRIWLFCCPIEHQTDGCAVQRDLDFHSSWSREILKQMDAPIAVILLGLHKELMEECEATFLDNYERLIPDRGFGDLVVRRGFWQYKTDGSAAPHMTARFNAATRMLEPIRVEEGEEPKTAKDFGFSEEEDELVATEVKDDDEHDGSDDNDGSENEDNGADEDDEGEDREDEHDASEVGDVVDEDAGS